MEDEPNLRRLVMKKAAGWWCLKSSLLYRGVHENGLLNVHSLYLSLSSLSTQSAERTLLKKPAVFFFVLNVQHQFFMKIIKLNISAMGGEINPPITPPPIPKIARHSKSYK